MAFEEPLRQILKREFNRNWPFLVGFGITFAVITKMSLGLTDEDAKNSPFVQRHGKRLGCCLNGFAKCQAEERSLALSLWMCGVRSQGNLCYVLQPSMAYPYKSVSRIVFGETITQTPVPPEFYRGFPPSYVACMPFS
eukprot:Gb_35148 [translate_table: standard]